MDTTSANHFKDNLNHYLEKVISSHTPLKVTLHSGDFVVISAEDWEREQETLYVLQNHRLMQQIAQSLSSHLEGKGYNPSQEQLDEIISL